MFIFIFLSFSSRVLTLWHNHHKNTCLIKISKPFKLLWIWCPVKHIHDVKISLDKALPKVNKNLIKASVIYHLVHVPLSKVTAKVKCNGFTQTADVICSGICSHYETDDCYKFHPKKKEVGCQGLLTKGGMTGASCDRLLTLHNVWWETFTDTKMFCWTGFDWFDHQILKNQMNYNASKSLECNR